MPRWPSPAASALAAATTGAHLALGLAMRAPIIHPDEVGQLGAARFLAGRGAAPEADALPAYSAVLAPVARLASSPLELWRSALVVNAVLAGVVVLLCAALVRRLAPGLSQARRLVVVAAVAAYPPIVLWSNLAIAENLLIPAFLAVVLLAWRALEAGGPGRWVAAGAAAGVAAGTHPRAFVIPMALVVTALLAGRSVGGRWRPAAWAALGAGPLLLAGLLAAQQGGRQVPRPVLSPDRLADVPVLIAGQVWYLTVATWGLFPLGLAAALGGLGGLGGLVRRRHGVPGSAGGPGRAAGEAATGTFVGACTLATLVTGALYAREDGSLDSLISGRAAEGLLAPVLLWGLVGLIRPAMAARTGRRWAEVARHLVVVAGTLAVTGAALAAGRGATEIELPVVRTDILGIDALLTWRALVLSVVLFSAAALVGAALLVGASRRGPAAAAGLAALLFLPALVTGQDFMVDGSRQRATERAVADAIAAVDRRLGGIPGGCVGYDRATLSHWHRSNYELFFGDVRLKNFTSADGERPCSTLAVSGQDDFAVAFPGSRRVMLENHYDQALWALPGTVHNELDAAGWLLPDRLPSPVPPGARRYAISLADAGSVPPAIAMRRGGRHVVDVTVTHAGTSQPWPSTHGLQSEFQAVRIGVRWYRLGKPGLPDGHSSLDRTRVELPRTLFPGERATVRVPLETTGKDGVPLRAGTYQARVEVVQNSVAWFEPVGPPLVLDVVVVGRIF